MECLKIDKKKRKKNSRFDFLHFKKFKPENRDKILICNFENEEAVAVGIRKEVGGFRCRTKENVGEAWR